MQWLDAPVGVLIFRRGDNFACVVNFSASPVELPAELVAASVIVASAESVHGTIAANSASWLELQTAV